MAASMSMNAATEASPKQPASHKSNMDSMYRLQRHIYDATRAYYLLGRDQMLKDLAPPSAGRVLEIGCGTGRNLALAAKLYPDAQFYGVDISDEMLKTAAARIARETLSERVSLFQLDAMTLSSHSLLSSIKFDRIYFSYTLSMIPDWRGALEVATTLLSPEGRLHLVDFGPCTDLPKLFATALRRWLSTFGVTPRDALVYTLGETGLNANFVSTLKTSHRGYAVHLVLAHRGKTLAARHSHAHLRGDF
jgi:S-adenosylmethionine-diacylgycerolhomoserine-N-methlytransferase